MGDNLSQKEILLRLMDKMDSVEREQSEHHSYAKAKLESIEAQALKTNGRVSSSEQEITNIKKDVTNAKTVFATLATILTMAWAGVTFLF